MCNLYMYNYLLYIYTLPLIITCEAPMALAANKDTSPIGPMLIKNKKSIFFFATISHFPEVML